MATILIVHGAGSGGWLWRLVRARLQRAGHAVFTPTLTGVGERAHLAGCDVDLARHIEDICGVLEYEDLHDVLLVGHSYGGMVIAGVADRAAERLARVVYLDAFVPGNGQSMFDLIPAPVAAMFRQQALVTDDGREVAPPLPYPHLGRIGPGGLPEAEVRHLLDRRVPQALPTYTQPVQLANPAAAALPHTYILCTDKGSGPDILAAMGGRARAQGWDYYELVAGHFPMLTTPEELSDLLLQLV